MRIGRFIAYGFAFFLPITADAQTGSHASTTAAQSEASAESLKVFSELFSDSSMGSLGSSSQSSLVKQLVRSASEVRPDAALMNDLITDFDSNKKSLVGFLNEVEAQLGGNATKLARLKQSLDRARSLRGLPHPPLVGAERCLPFILIFFAARDWLFSYRGSFVKTESNEADLAWARFGETLSKGLLAPVAVACLTDIVSGKRKLSSYVDDFSLWLRKRRNGKELGQALELLKGEATELEKLRRGAQAIDDLAKMSTSEHAKLATDLTQLEARENRGIVRAGLSRLDEINRERWNNETFAKLLSRWKEYLADRKSQQKLAKIFASLPRDQAQSLRRFVDGGALDGAESLTKDAFEDLELKWRSHFEEWLKIKDPVLMDEVLAHTKNIEEALSKNRDLVRTGMSRLTKLCYAGLAATWAVLDHEASIGGKSTALDDGSEDFVRQNREPLARAAIVGGTAPCVGRVLLFPFDRVREDRLKADPLRKLTKKDWESIRGALHDLRPDSLEGPHPSISEDEVRAGLLKAVRNFRNRAFETRPETVPDFCKGLLKLFTFE